MAFFFKRKSTEELIESAVNSRVNDILSNIDKGIILENVKKTADIQSGSFKGRQIQKKIISNLTVKENKRVINRNGTFITTVSPYNYKDIDKYFTKESYFARSISRQYETLLRNGFEYKSDHKKYITEIIRKLRYIEKNNHVKLDQTFARCHMDLSKFGICIVEKIYSKDNSSLTGKRLERLRFLHPSNLLYYFTVNNNEFMGVDIIGNTGVKINNSISSGLSPRLQRIVDNAGRSKGKIPDIPVDNLIILKLYQDDESWFPEPPPIQSLADILTLRSIEETIEFLIFQYGSPFLHAMVGNDEYPAVTGEVDIVTDRVEQMASNGFVVTDHRVKFSPIKLLENPGDFTPILDYFKTRILVGSGSSSVSLGEGQTANRSTAESIDDALADHCMYYANIMSYMMNYHIIEDILSESVNYKDILDEDGDLLVEIEFNEVKLEKQIAKQNSIINLFHSNLLPFDRALKKLNELPVNKTDEKELYINKIQIPLAQAKGIESGSEGSTSSAVSPSNQHGKKPGPGSTKN